MFLFQLIAKSESGGCGPRALPPAMAEQKKGQGMYSQYELEQKLWVYNFVLHREKIADAENNGANCVSARKTIPLTESNTCNNVGCATMNHGKNGANSFEMTTLITQRVSGKYYFADFFL